MRIAHLSDTHLKAGPVAAEPAFSLDWAVGRLLALEPRPDCVVITGDLADTGHPDEYAALHSILRRCRIPVHLVVGNHDNPVAMVDEFGGTPFLGGGSSTYYKVDYPQATVIVLDSRVPGRDEGVLGAGRLSWLDEALSSRRDVPAFVCVHHPPVAVGIPYLDAMRLVDGEAFGDVIRKHPHVVRVLCGHVHRTVSVPFAGTLVTIAPSTYRQSSLRMHDTQPPGYLAEPTGLLLHLLDNGGCVTHLVAVSHASAVLG
jgi:3',5'-cyclic AMP phosphodiesterase CpdA